MGSLAAGIVLGGFFTKNGAPFSVKDDKGRVKLNKLIDLIEQEYVDNVNTDSIIDMTVNNILAQLDPHSIYISKSEFDEVQNVMKGSFVGTTPISYKNLCQKRAYRRCSTACSAPPIYTSTGSHFFSFSGEASSSVL